jgi:uncharacterized repeat protein (TIGR01451 family)
MSPRDKSCQSACRFGLLLVVALAGCQALRGPEPLGPTLVAPPGTTVTPGNAAVAATPPQVQLPAPPQVQLPSQTFVPTPQPSPAPAVAQPSPVQPAAPLAMHIVAPTQGAVGSILTYRVEIRNNTAQAARGIGVTCPVPAGATFVSSNPQATVAGRQLQWQLADLPGAAATAVDISFRPDAAVTLSFCVDVRSASGTLLRACPNTPIVGSIVQPPAGQVPPGNVPPPPGATSQLSVSMTGPQSARIGEEVTFRITVTNAGPTAATRLIVTDTFDPGLVHRKATSPIERDLEDIAAGQSRAFDVTFRVTQAGQLCNNVTVTGQGGLSASARACVLGLANPTVSLRVTNRPASVAAGQKVLFNIEVQNTGEGDLTDLVVACRTDPPLRPTQATQFGDQPAKVTKTDAGYELSPWRFLRLPPGRSISLEVECQGELPAASACARVSVTSREGAREEKTACLAVAAAANPLLLTLGSSADPVKTGEEVGYVLSVTNNGKAPLTNLAVQFTLSSHLSPPRAPEKNPTPSRVEGRTLSFDPLPQLRPGETQTYRIRAQAQRTGAATVDVAVQADGIAAVREQKTTTVQASGGR